MKPKFGRETLLLSLLALLLGALTWSNQRDGLGSGRKTAEVEVLEAAMFPPWFWGNFELHLRHKHRVRWWPASGRGAKRLRLLDGDGRDVVLFTKYDPIEKREISLGDAESASAPNPGLPVTDLIVSVSTNYAAPKGGWNSVKRPLWIEGEVSDGKCLPTPFKVRIEERGGDRRDFGVR